MPVVSRAGALAAPAEPGYGTDPGVSPRQTAQVDRGSAAQRRENAAPPGSGAKVRNSEAGAVQSTRPSFGRHRKSEGRIARRSRQGENLAMPPGKTRNREIGKIKKG